jgi:hypothetical protein
MKSPSKVRELWITKLPFITSIDNLVSQAPLSLNFSQECYCRGPQQRSTRYLNLVDYGQFKEIAEQRNRFPTTSSIKAVLTYISDVTRQNADCQAMSLYKVDEEDDLGKDTAQCVTIGCNPKWNFDPRGFQGRTSRDIEDRSYKLFLDFTKKHGSNISHLDFQHALFCLAGNQLAEDYISKHRNEVFIALLVTV